MNLTLAALSALLDDDIANFLVAATPGGIEAQEARGQQQLVNSSVLPLDIGRNVTWEQLTEIGIIRGEQVDDLFVNVTLPAGWYKKATDHSMWSDLVDEQGRVRASIFYKAAFYDRSAHLSLTTRYYYTVEPITKEDLEGLWHGVVKDQGSVIWSTTGTAMPKDWDKRDTLERVARLYIETNYPDYRDPFAYW